MVRKKDTTRQIIRRHIATMTTLKLRRVGKGEFHPQTSLRTVREPLDSYGSSNSYNQ